MPNIEYGGYKFFNTPILPEGELTQNLSFRSETFKAIYIADGNLYYTKSDGFDIQVWNATSGWNTSEPFDVNPAQFISVDYSQSVSDEFYEWFMANVEPATASVTYKGNKLADLFAGTRATLATSGRRMGGDLIIELAKGGGNGGPALDALVEEQSRIIAQLQAALNDKTSGSGSCSGDHVIEVSELPTTGMSETDVYKIVKPTFTDIIIVEDGRPVSFDLVTPILGISNISYNYCTTKPTENIKGSDIDEVTALHFYFVRDDSDIFIYDKNNEQWVSASILLNANLNDEDPHYTFGEAIFDKDEATANYCYYAVIGDSDNCLYSYNSNNVGFTDVIVSYYGILTLPLESFALLTDGFDVHYHRAETFDSAEIFDSSYDDRILHVYYIDESSDDLYVHDIEDGWESLGWNYVWGDYCGVAASRSEAYPLLSGISNGYVAVISDGWTKHILPSGMVRVSENGLYNVTEKESILVDVDTSIPDGYVWPSGTYYISDNGTYDVRYSEYAEVNISPGAASYIVEKASDLPSDALDGSFAIILEG